MCSNPVSCPFSGASLASAVGAVSGLAVGLKGDGPLIRPSYFLLAPLAMAAFVYIQGSTALSQKNIVGHIGVGLVGAAIGYWLYGQPAVINGFVGALGGFGIFGAAALLLLL